MQSQSTANKVLWAAGIALLAYALVGNYVALPGYIRFLERGGTSEAGNAFDLDVFIGAARTIAWMYSFQLGVLCLAAAYALRHSLHTRELVIGTLIWLVLWSWPTLPAPGAWFYILFGSVLLIAIAATLSRTQQVGPTSRAKTLFLGALIFFAFATWEICGLGTTGRMLHPEQAAGPVPHNLLITQSSKLMIEFVIACTLILASLVLGGRDQLSR